MRRGWAAAESRALRVKPRDDVAAMTQTVQAVPEVLQIRPPGGRRTQRRRILSDWGVRSSPAASIISTRRRGSGS
jgi:hypothetical protein